ncbi:MAG: hypothetical protein AAF961_14105 [Planctomycetota bacterium]
MLPQAIILLIDYVNRRRIKPWDMVRAVEEDADLEARLSEPQYPGEVERVIWSSC